MTCVMLSISLFVMILYALSKSTEIVDIAKENKELKKELTQAYKTIDRLKYPSSY